MNFTVTPVLREDQPNRKGLCPINIYVYTKGEKIKFAVKKKVHPDYWDKEKKRVKLEHPLATFINLKIEKQTSDIKSKIITEILNKIEEEKIDIRLILKRGKDK